MTTPVQNQWVRKIGLILTDQSGQGIDLSNMRIQFNVQNADVESPNNAAIRVYNLNTDTVNYVVGGGEFSKVTLNAGYEQGDNYGTIFTGTIKQFRIGKESNTDTYLDILAADGDLGYNQGVVNTPLAKNTSIQDRIQAAADAMPDLILNMLPNLSDKQHVPQLRGKVLFGMARQHMRFLCNSINCTWSIQKGKIVITPRTGYVAGQVVEINHLTGLIGMPEQTDEGIKLRCLMNPNLRIGGLIKLNNEEINQLQAAKNNKANTVFNSYEIQRNAPLSTKDGTYKIFVCEYEGDSRGGPWYSNLIALAMNPSGGNFYGSAT